jgi:hypothetical protein
MILNANFTKWQNNAVPMLRARERGRVKISIIFSKIIYYKILFTAAKETFFPRHKSGLVKKTNPITES